MKKSIIVPALIATVTLLGCTMSAQAQAPTFDTLFQHYDAVRTALSNDTLAGVPNAAEDLAKAADAGSNESPVLKAVADQARAVAKAAKIDEARAAFGRLSSSMVEYRKQTNPKSGVVIYCGMARNRWIQRDAKVANPYYGSSMAKCGEVVKD